MAEIRKPKHVKAVDNSAAEAMTAGLQVEVEEERLRLQSAEAQGKRGKRHSDGDTKCAFCPFRKFREPGRVLKHLDKYHTEARGFVAGSGKNAQWDLIRAMHNQSRELVPVVQPPAKATLLRDSADLMRDWIKADGEVAAWLEKQNELEVVLLLSAEGPRYVLKAQTVNCRRVSGLEATGSVPGQRSHIYYDNTFANLVFGLALKHKGKVSTTFQDLTTHFVGLGSPCAGLVPKNKPARNAIVDDVFALPEVDQLRAKLVAAATAKGEWEVLGHDATFKCLMSVVGQKKMDQKDGELHALHTLYGKTGAVPGASPQPSEARKYTKAACKEILPAAARATTKYMGSDTPSSLEGLVKTADVFPELVAIFEDGMHLPFRIDDCFGGHRTAVGARVVSLHQKFRVPRNGTFYHGEQASPSEEGVWQPSRGKNRFKNLDWSIYVAKPYKKHQDYIDDLCALVLEFPSDMNRSNSKGRTVEDILKSGASFEHYMYLLNGSIVLYHLPPSDRNKLAWGTTGNEALHNQIKAAERTTVQQHASRVATRMKAFSLCKMLAHNAAAYSPTTHQQQESDVISSIAGAVVREFFPPFGTAPTPVVTSRAESKVPHAMKGPRSSAVVETVRKARDQAWEQEKTLRKEKKEKQPWRLHSTGLQKKKRTVFTRLKAKKGKRVVVVG